MSRQHPKNNMLLKGGPRATKVSTMNNFPKESCRRTSLNAMSRNPMRHHSRTNIGFTLVEMSIVVALIALLSFMAIPSLSRMREREVSREVANTIANRLKMVRAHAKTQGEPLRVTITIGNGTPNNLGNITVERGVAFCRDTVTTPDASGFCPNGERARPPVTCPELEVQALAGNLLPFRSGGVDVVPFQGISGDNYIVGMSTGENSRSICFAPDGRILGMNGRTLQSPANVLCSGENFAIFLVQNAIRGGTLDYDQLSRCGNNQVTLAGARDQFNFHRIILPYMGSIRATQ